MSAARKPGATIGMNAPTTPAVHALPRIFPAHRSPDAQLSPTTVTREPERCLVERIRWSEAGDSHRRTEICKTVGSAYIAPGVPRGAVTRDLVSARASRAVALGADRLWMRCVENSPSHRLALSHGWTWWARTEFEGPAALQQAVLLARPLRERQARRPGT
jgi:hypothetical protein